MMINLLAITLIGITIGILTEHEKNLKTKAMELMEQQEWEESKAQREWLKKREDENFKEVCDIE